MSEASGKGVGGKKKSRQARDVGREVEWSQPVKAGFLWTQTECGGDERSSPVTGDK